MRPSYYPTKRATSSYNDSSHSVSGSRVMPLEHFRDSGWTRGVRMVFHWYEVPGTWYKVRFTWYNQKGSRKGVFDKTV